MVHLLALSAAASMPRAAAQVPLAVPHALPSGRAQVNGSGSGKLLVDCVWAALDIHMHCLQVAPLPADLLDRRVEITGPVDRKMVINALNSGASVFMADFEDSNAPTW